MKSAFHFVLYHYHHFLYKHQVNGKYIDYHYVRMQRHYVKIKNCDRIK